MKNKRVLFTVSLICACLFTLIFILQTRVKNGPLNLCFNGAVEKIQYDTGYGYNKFQTVEPLQNEDSVSGSLCPQIVYKKVFKKVVGLKIYSSRPDLQVYRNTGGQLQDISKSLQSAEAGAYTLDQFVSDRRPTTLKEDFFYLLGITIISILAALYFYYFRDLARLSEKPRSFLALLSLFLISAHILIWIFFYPGPLNVFNPVHALHEYSNFHFSYADSVFIQILWGALFELYPSIYFIIIFQNLLLLATTLYLFKFAVQMQMNKLLLVAVALLFFVHPQALLQNLYLERSIWSAYFNATVIFSAFLIFYSPLQNKKLWLIFCLSAFFSAMTRSENIVFLAPLLGWLCFKKLPVKRAVAAFSTFVFLYFLHTAVINKILHVKTHDPVYTSLNLIPPLADLLKLNKPKVDFLTKREAETISAVVDLEGISQGEAFASFDINKSMKPASAEQHLQFQKVFTELALKNFPHFFQSKWTLFLHTISNPSSGHNITDTLQYIVDSRVFDLGYIPLSFVEKKNGQFIGFRDSFNFYRLSVKHFSYLHWQLIVLLVCILLFSYAPASAWLAAFFGLRLAVVFLMAPTPNYFYYADLFYLGGVFALFLFHELKTNLRRSFPVTALLRIFQF